MQTRSPRITDVVEYYAELEAHNLTANDNKLYVKCLCGQEHMKPSVSMLEEKHFGQQKTCSCGRVIFTIGKIITYREYHSGKGV